MTEDRIDNDGARMRTTELTAGYGDRVVLDALDVSIPDGSFTVIIGQNACGKSTLLRALSRMLKLTHGSVFLDGKAISALPAKELARTLGLLPQSPIAPDGITVADLVARGRYPHQKLLRQWSAEDARLVEEAMVATGVDELADRLVDELSGGQRQRVWIAMVLAQRTGVLLLDEPTTFLDIAHAVEVLELCSDLHTREQRTLVAVLHDINHACRYATNLIAMKHGSVLANGRPDEIVTAELIEEVFDQPVRVIDDPETGSPIVLPRARRLPVNGPAERAHSRG